MAKLSTIVKAEKKKKLADRMYAKRKALRAQSLDETLSFEEREAAFMKLQKLPRNSSSVRVRRRCSITGRGRGGYKKFGISRIKFRELANQGMIPGVTKASW